MTFDLSIVAYMHLLRAIDAVLLGPHSVVQQRPSVRGGPASRVDALVLDVVSNAA